MTVSCNCNYFKGILVSSSWITWSKSKSVSITSFSCFIKAAWIRIAVGWYSWIVPESFSASQARRPGMVMITSLSHSVRQANIKAACFINNSIFVWSIKRVVNSRSWEPNGCLNTQIISRTSLFVCYRCWHLWWTCAWVCCTKNWSGVGNWVDFAGRDIKNFSNISVKVYSEISWSCYGISYTSLKAVIW